MKLAWLAAAVITLGGCAKFPDTGSQTPTKRLIFSMTLDRQVNENYVYIVALRPTVEANPTDQGPIPVVSEPWGNGFVAGNVRYFVRWDPLTSPNYILYRFAPGNLLEWEQIGVPINADDVPPGGATLRFELDINQIADTPTEAAQFQTLQVNFLTMDRVPQGSDPGNKVLDALGDTRLPTEIDEFVEIPLSTSGVYNNARFNNLEPLGDSPDPDLDFVDWSIEVRAQQ